MRHFFAFFACLLATATTALASAPAPARLGILMPVGPKDYHVVFDNMKIDRHEQFGPFAYDVGTIRGVPVVVTIPSGDGPLIRSFAAAEMLHHYNIKAILYPGTSGAHLPTDRMRVGDIVLGAENVDFGNFFISHSGEIEASQFETKGAYAGLYTDPRLLSALACAAQRVVSRSTVPAWLDANAQERKPDIFYFGIQGTSRMWLADVDLMSKIQRTFHEVDEDGDWYSDLLAVMYHVPFIEVSAISDSIFQFPETARGIPKTPDPTLPSASVIAQRFSNEIMIELIARDGMKILNGHFTTPLTDPYPAGSFDDPKNPGTLLAGCPA